MPEFLQCYRVEVCNNLQTSGDTPDVVQYCLFKMTCLSNSVHFIFHV